MHAPSPSPAPAAYEPSRAAYADPRDQPQALRLAADVWRAVRGHWRIAALFFVLANAAVLGGIILCPRTYVSEAKVKVNAGRESTVSETGRYAEGSAVALQNNREQDLNTAVDVLESRAVLAYAVKQIGPEPILKGYVPAEGEQGEATDGALDPETAQQVDGGPLAAIGLSDPVSRFEKAVETLGQILEVNSNKKSDVISISVEAGKPALAQRICAEIISGFRVKYSDASEIEGGSEFFAQKADGAKADLDKAAGLLATELNALGISTVEGRRQQLQEELSRLSSEEMDRRKVLEGTIAEIAGYDRVLASTPEEIDAGQTENQATGAPDTLRKEIASMEARREKIVQETSAKAPGAVRLEQQIAANVALLKTLSDDSKQTTTSANPVWQDLTKSKLTAQARAEGLRAELSAIRDQRQEAGRAIAELNKRESRILALQTERDELAKGLGRYVELREQAKVADEMGAQSISSVKVFQEPSFNAKPVAPKKRLIAAAGLVFAGFGALGLCLVLEYKSIFFPEDQAAALDRDGVNDGRTNGWAEPETTGYRPAETPLETAAVHRSAGNGHATGAYVDSGTDAGAEPTIADRPR
ncbi:hypothetical protein LzC2_06040 [Planctomycetes bacterium LzC2]|uniref:Polysaccharide chain length determinant N-terminal domain-containing protein n=2 Tax=Alienimonas chondri TaxID=2681879 RepID=A0ABX1VAU7_9PLAN|nr:hypothetical protein [Alienimonas chondri]